MGSMEYVIGVLLALAVAGLAATIFRRERAFYPIVAIVVASYYVLFAAMDGSGRTVIAESVAAAGFLVLALIGFRRNMWLVAVALAGHGVLDFFHHYLVTNPGVPSWWPGFCLAFDVVAGIACAWQLMRASHSVVSA